VICGRAKEIIMTGTPASRVLLAAAGCLLLASCGTAKSTTAPAAANPAATSAAARAAATSSAAAPADASMAATTGGGAITACRLITEQDASGALGRAAGQGTAGGSAALSECIYDQGALIVSVRADSKAFYDKSRASALAKGASDVPGVGDSAFKAGPDNFCTLLFVKGTTIVSILFGGTGAQRGAVTVAKIAASKL
jgi:hypothetical protein